MDPTSLYYTFTTIAQALAGAFGVLAAFSVLVLTRTEGDVRDAQAALLTMKDPYEPTWEAFRNEALRGQGVDAFLTQEFPNIPPPDGRLYRLRSGAVALGMQRKLRRQLTIAALLTAIDVGLSIVAIPWVPALACSAKWSVTVTALAVAGALTCLALYGRVVAVAVGDGGKSTAQERRS